MRTVLVSLLLTVIVLCPAIANAQGLSIIRDTEIERALKDWASPVMRAAGLSDNQVDIVLVNDSTVNAFVAGGANLFMYAGLIQEADYVDEVIGVMAHEIGHIKGGHLIAGRRAMERASYQSILGTVLGVGAAIFSGDGRAAGALSAGGAGLAQQGFLGHSRAQESAADQAALSYFETAGRSPEGMVTFLKKLEGQELLPASQQSQYMRTHPLTRDRIASMQRGLERSSHGGDYAPTDQAEEFNRVKAKLIAFRTPQDVPRFYPVEEESQSARYAHAIMDYQTRHYDRAVEKFDALINDYPSNPYYKEMKAQTLRDSGNLSDATTAYQQALDQMNGQAPQIQIALAHVLIENNGNMDRAEKLLQQALTAERRDPVPYRLLATIEGRRNNETAARYYLAEEAAAQGRKDEASRLVNGALNDQSLTGNLRVKAQDLKSYLDGLPTDDN